MSAPRVSSRWTTWWCPFRQASNIGVLPSTSLAFVSWLLASTSASTQSTLSFLTRQCHVCFQQECQHHVCSVFLSVAGVQVINKKQVSLDATLLKCLPLLHKCIWSCYDLDLWALTLKTFPTMATHMMNICDKFCWNLSTKYGDIASHEIGVNGRLHGWMDSCTDGRPNDQKTQASRHLLLVAERLIKLNTWTVTSREHTGQQYARLFSPPDL